MRYCISLPMFAVAALVLGFGPVSAKAAPAASPAASWWQEPGDNIVDLPLAIEEILVEQRTHILYVNDVQPVSSDTVLLGQLYVEYETPEDATDEAVRESRRRLPWPKDVPELPNPVVDMEREGVGRRPGSPDSRRPITTMTARGCTCSSIRWPAPRSTCSGSAPMPTGAGL